MKAITLTLLVFTLTFAVSTQAQKVKEKDILGTWKLVIDIEDKLDEEADNADTLLEEVIISSVSGLVGGILENIDIYFEFEKNNRLYIRVDAYDEVDEEVGRWFLNDKGYLVIEDHDEDGFSISDNDEWMLIDGVLVNEDHEDDGNVYMARVD